MYERLNDGVLSYFSKVVVQVGDWQEVSAVSVDRVGTYFRQAKPIPKLPMDYGTELPTARCEIS